MRDWEGENLPVKLYLTANESKELDGSSRRKCHAMGICRSAMSSAAAPHFTLEVRNRKYIWVSGHEVRLVARDEVANERGKLVEHKQPEAPRFWS
jgi:hypothetical protein